MNKISSYMEHDHGRCDAQYALAEALAARDSDVFFEHADTLRILMHQHNLKEESILYPMADRLLQQQGDAVLAMLCAQQLAAGA